MVGSLRSRCFQGGYTKKIGDAVVVVPVIDEATITPHSEAFQAVVWHALSCHPKLMLQQNKWESLGSS